MAGRDIGKFPQLSRGPLKINDLDFLCGKSFELVRTAEPDPKLNEWAERTKNCPKCIYHGGLRTLCKRCRATMPAGYVKLKVMEKSAKRELGSRRA